MAKMSKDSDHHMAMLLQQQFDSEFSVENPGQDLAYSNPKKKKRVAANSSKCLIDPSWELVDPTPNIHILFVQFSQRFFWDKLLAVTVAWSKRMTSCAGICSYQGRGGMCSITLSEPLLKLRPRKDLVETLLHEMIHAYLFVSHNNRDRDGHGPEFHNHMYRINGEAGTNITVFHSFHDEVMLYKQHWWRCEGACQKRPPFFGMVRRAMNRAPGLNDRWWAEHERNCGGKFIKVKEPEKKTAAKKSVSSSKTSQSNKENSCINLPDIRNFLPVTNSSSNKSTNSTKTSNIQTIKSVKGGGVKNSTGTAIINSKTTEPGCKNSDLDVSSVISTNANIVGFTNSRTQHTASQKNSIEVFSGAGKKLSNNSIPPKDMNAVKHHWANKFLSTPVSSTSTNNNETVTKRKPPISKSASAKKAKIPDTCPCPNCNKRIEKDELNSHLNICLNQDKNIRNEFSDDDSAIFVKCPVCSENIDEKLLNRHLDNCLNELNKSNPVPKPTIKVTKPKTVENATTTKRNKSDDNDNNKTNTGKNKRRSKTPETIVDSTKLHDNENANKTKKRRSKTPEKISETSDKKSVTVIRCFETTPNNTMSEQSTENTLTTIKCFTSSGKPQMRSVSMEEIEKTSESKHSLITRPDPVAKKTRRKSESDKNNIGKTNRRKSTENPSPSSGFSKSQCRQKYSGEKVDMLAAQEYLSKVYNSNKEEDFDSPCTTTDTSELVPCLVCNQKIEKSNLNLHLEDCVGTAFNGEQPEDTNSDENESEGEEIKDNMEYNCPICMKSVDEGIMNRHIDECLNMVALQNENFFDD